MIWHRRFPARLRPAADPGEAQRIERVLGTARVFLAVCSLLAIYLDPTEPSRYATLAYALLLLYVIHSVAVLVVLRLRASSPPVLAIVLQSVDVLWAACITLLTEGPNSPFFLFFLFVMLAAAYRWGLRETVMTGATAVLLVLVEAILLGLGRIAPVPLEGEFELNRFIMRSTYLLLMAFLLGYLGEQQKQLEAEDAVLMRLMARVQGEAGLAKTVQGLFGDALRLFEARSAIVVAREENTARVFFWEVRRSGEETAVRLSELDFPERQKYFYPVPCNSWHAARMPRRAPDFSFEGLDSEGKRLRNVRFELPGAFQAAHPFQAVMAVSYEFAHEWSGRVFLLDPGLDWAPAAELAFLQRLVRQIGPAVYNVFLLRRLRSRAGAIERARVARELHDGAIQSLTGVEMQVDVLRRRAAAQGGSLAAELSRVQQLLREEILNLRELMEQLKPVEVTPKQFLEFLADIVEKFRRETGISATFVCDLAEVNLPSRAARELARIVQEALSNVRKHSGARNVLVSLNSQNGNWVLVVDDDGRGFPFSGRFSHSELDAARRGPLVIKERVHSLGGQLTVESAAGHGARLEITFPQKARY